MDSPMESKENMEPRLNMSDAGTDRPKAARERAHENMKATITRGIRYTQPDLDAEPPTTLPISQIPTVDRPQVTSLTLSRSQSPSTQRTDDLRYAKQCLQGSPRAKSVFPSSEEKRPKTVSVIDLESQSRSSSNEGDYRRTENPFMPFTNVPTSEKPDLPLRLSTDNSHSALTSLPSIDGKVVSKRAGEAHQQQQTRVDSNGRKRPKLNTESYLADDAFGSSHDIAGPDATEYGTDETVFANASSTPKSTLAAPSKAIGRDFELTCATPREVQEKGSRLHAVRYSNEITTQQITETQRQASQIPSKRGRPRRLKLPRPGEPDFIGPLNRRGRKVTADFEIKDKGTGRVTKNADEGEHEVFSGQNTSQRGPKRKLETLHETCLPDPPLAAVPVLVRSTKDHHAERKLEIRYQQPSSSKESLAHDSQRMLEVDCNGMSRRRVNALIALFDDMVYPFIQALINNYRGFHADIEIQIIGLDVTLEMLKVTLPELIRVRRDPTTHQQMVIKRFVKEVFCRKVQGYSRESGTAPPNPSEFSCLPLYKAEESPFYDLTYEDTAEFPVGSSVSDSNGQIPDAASPSGNVGWKRSPSNPYHADYPTVSRSAENVESARLDRSRWRLPADHKSLLAAKDSASDRQAVSPNPFSLLTYCNQSRSAVPSLDSGSGKSATKTLAAHCEASVLSPGKDGSWPQVLRTDSVYGDPLHHRLSSSRASNQEVKVNSAHKTGLSIVKRQGPRIKSRYENDMAIHSPDPESRMSGIKSSLDQRVTPSMSHAKVGASNHSLPVKSSRTNGGDKSIKWESTTSDSAQDFSLNPSAPTWTQHSDLHRNLNHYDPTIADGIISTSAQEPIDLILEGSQQADQARRSTNIPSTQPSSLNLSKNLSKSAYRQNTGPASTFRRSRLAIRSRMKMEASKDDVQAKPILEPPLVLLAASLGRSSSPSHVPYKPDRKLRAKLLDENHAIKHVDFSALEVEAIYAAASDIRGPLADEKHSQTDHPQTGLGKLERRLNDCNGDHLDAIADLAHSKTELASTRKRNDIRKFLSTIIEGTSTAAPSIKRVEHRIVEPDPGPNVAALLRHRELDFRAGGRHTQHELRYAVIDNLTHVRSWKGASGDVVCAAWNPNSQTYAAGATATANAEDLQYNRPNNLLYGNTNRNTLRELPDHRIPRPKPDTIVSGPNSSAAVYDACDPMVYKSVSAIQFSPGGERFYSASHDATVKVWSTEQEDPFCIETLVHDANVAALEASGRLPRIFATASHTIINSVRVYSHREDDTYDYISFDSSRSRQKPQHEIYPECLRLGLTSSTEHLLLAGFTRWGELPDYNPAREGDLCLWDVHTGQKLRAMPSAQSIYTAAFHPFLDVFSTGGAPGLRLTHQHTTRSVVRSWDRRRGGPHAMIEYECPSLDMQDLAFHPRNQQILAVGCTDGSVYVWDARYPEWPLHHFQHGEPITDWDHKYSNPPMTREQGDAGVNMTLWGAGRHHLYTGATDGIVKCWDIDRAPEDALVRDVVQLQAGISCGYFSSDHVSLLVGDSTGAVHILSSNPGGAGARQDSLPMEPQGIDFIPAVRTEPPPLGDQPGPGQLAARELLATGQLTIDPEFGIGQGPSYAGPYAAYAHEEGPPSATRLLREYEKEQPVSYKGRVRDNVAARNIKGTIARRREELGGSETVGLTSDMEEVVPAKKAPRDGALPSLLEEDELEDDHWFPRMDEELFARLQEKYT